MTTWRDNLLPGSFRGVPFKTLPLTTQIGRRNVVHEYPQRDKPYGEDLGRKARQYQVEAIVLGVDYLSQRDRLIAALESKGAGRLVHPTLGEMDVILSSPASMTEDLGVAGGSAKFSMTFTEAGDIAALTVTADTSKRVETAADAATATAQDAFGRTFDLGSDQPGLLSQVLNVLNGATAGIVGLINDIKSLPASLLADATSLVNAAIGDSQQILSAFSSLSDMLDLGILGALFASSSTGAVPTDSVPALSVASQIAVASATLSTTASSPAALAAVMTGVVQGFRGTTGTGGGVVGGFGLPGLSASRTVADGSAVSALAGTPFLALADAMPSAAGTGGVVSFDAVPAPDTALGTAQASNRQALAGLVRQVAVIEAVRAATDRDASYTTTAEAAATRDGLAGRLDAEMLASQDHDLTASLRALRATLVEDMDRRAAALPSLKTVLTTTVQPALVLAARYYDDPSRAADLVARNDVAHPGFVPAGRLTMIGVTA